MTIAKVIYDDEGYVYFVELGNPLSREPVGMQFLVEEIPEGKQLSSIEGIGVNIHVEPHRLILEDKPTDPLEELRREVIATQAAIDFIIMNQMGG